MNKKVILNSKVLDDNVDHLNDFLSKKGMSKIQGGISGDDVLSGEPEWGNTNYSESTKPLQPEPKRRRN